MARDDAIDPKDVIVVLGTTVAPDGTAGVRLARRVARGLAIAAEEPGALLLLTGGSLRGRRAEALAMQDLLRAEGIPDHRILLDTEARTTLENALNASRLLDELSGQGRLIVVTDRLHCPRAWLTFRAIGLSVEMAPAATPASTWLGGLAYEAAAFAWYLVKFAAGSHRRPKVEGDQSEGLS